MPYVRIVNQGQWNECTVRQMTDEERARYGPPAPVPERIKMMRRKAKENPHYRDVIDGFGLEMYDRPERTSEQTKEAAMNNLGPKVDRVRMYELCREHGTDNAAVKKIAGELGCSRQTVDHFIRKERVRERLAAESGESNPVKTENSFVHIEDVTPCPAPVIGLTVTGTNAAGERVVETVCVPGKTAEPVRAGTIVFGTDGTAAVKPVSEPDPAYYAALDELAHDFFEDSDNRRDVAKHIAANGMNGVRKQLNDWLLYLESSLSANQDRAEFHLGLSMIANTAVQGLMFLDTLEEW